jgi:ferritin-like metal-binding protein YciE
MGQREAAELLEQNFIEERQMLRKVGQVAQQLPQPMDSMAGSAAE